MKNFFYAARQVFKPRWIVLSKILSLTLGIATAGFIYTYVAFEKSYDAFMPNADQLYRIEIEYISAMEGPDKGVKTMAPTVPTLRVAMPQIESGTRFYNKNTGSIRIGQKHYSIKPMIADSAFFNTMGYKVLRGNPTIELTQRENIFISQELSLSIFGNEDPINKTLTYANTDYTIKGVFEDMPINSSIQFNLVFAALNTPTHFDGGDRWFSYIKLPKGVDVDDFTTQMNKTLAPYLTNWETVGYKLNHYLRPMNDVFFSEVKDVAMILSIVGLLIIFVSGLNYVLITLSSLAARAKEIGVHKANGANRRSIFSLITWETALFIIISTIFATLLLWALQSEIESLIETDIWAVFSIGNFWALALVLLAMLIVAGIIPAILFSRIPVTQIFRNITNIRSGWKKVLLFFQFFSATIILTFTLIVIKQYNTILTQDLGYNYTNLALVTIPNGTHAEYNRAQSELKQLSIIANVSKSSDYPTNGLSGIMICNAHDSISQDNISARFLSVDSLFFDVYGITFREGESEQISKGKTIVNQELISVFGATRSPLELLLDVEGSVLEVQAVTNHLIVSNAYYKNQPLVILPLDSTDYIGVMTVKFHDLTSQNIQAVNSKLETLFPGKVCKVRIYSNIIKKNYSQENTVKSALIAISIILVFITGLGIIGYIGTEIKRRSKEIAVRRVHGASGWSVIFTMMQTLLIIAIIACVIGLVSGFFVGQFILSFFTVQTTLIWQIFALTAIIIIGLLLVTVTIQSWTIANQNPSRSIKNE